MATAAAARLTSPIWQRDAIPTGSEFYHAIAVKKLVLRVGPSLSSPKVGNVKPGTKLTALGREVVDGVLRIKVGVDTSPRGVCCSAQGWVTAEKDGEVKLRISREGAGMPSTATSTALYLRNAKSEDVVDPSFLRLGHADGSRNVSESMATRIAKRRQTWRTSGSSGSGGGGSGSGGGGGSGGTSANVTETETLQGNVGDETEGADEEVGKGNGAEAKLSKVLLESSQALRERAAEKTAEADSQSEMTFDTITTQIGKLLVRSGKRVEELMVEWDRNKDGEISKQEFRLHIRQLGLTGAQVETRQLDAL